MTLRERQRAVWIDHALVELVHERALQEGRTIREQCELLVAYGLAEERRPGKAKGGPHEIHKPRGH